MIQFSSSHHRGLNFLTPGSSSAHTPTHTCMLASMRTAYTSRVLTRALAYVARANTHTHARTRTCLFAGEYVYGVVGSNDCTNYDKITGFNACEAAAKSVGARRFVARARVVGCICISAIFKCISQCLCRQVVRRQCSVHHAPERLLLVDPAGTCSTARAPLRCRYSAP